MIEEIVIKYLSKRLPYPVYAERPPERDERYYLVEKVGGDRRNRIRHAIVAIQSVAVANPGISRAVAAGMDEELIDVMLERGGGIAALPQISSAELNSDYDYTKPDSGEYRYQAVFNISHY